MTDAAALCARCACVGGVSRSNRPGLSICQNSCSAPQPPLKYSRGEHAKISLIYLLPSTSAVYFFPSRYYGAIIMSGGLPCVCCLPCTDSDPQALLSPETVTMRSRTSHLGAQHSFDSDPCHHVVSRPPTGCQGRLLARLVRLSYRMSPEASLRSTFISFFFFSSSYRTRDGSRICDGMGTLTRIMIGLAISMYRCHYPPLPLY